MSTATIPFVNSQPSEYDYHALAVAGRQSSSKLRDALRPGKYPVDTVVRVKGVLTVGEDSSYETKTKPDTALALAVVLSQFQPQTRERILRKLPKLIGQSGIVSVDSDLLRRCDQATAECAVVSTRPRRGAVGGSFVVSLV